MKNYVAVFLIGVVLGCGGFWAYQDSQIIDAVVIFQEQIDSQELVLSSLLSETDNNEVDEIATKIIDSCSAAEQRRFDTLLNSLPSLSAIELEEAKKGLTTCGDVTASNKLYMVGVLERELLVLENLYALSALITGEALSQDRLEVYQTLVRLESERAASLYAFVSLQEEIIIKLIDGVDAESNEMQSVTVKVQEERETYSVLKTQLKTYKEQL